MQSTRSVPDIDLQYKLDAPIISVSNSVQEDKTATNYQLIPINRCRACKNCDKKVNTKSPIQTTPQLTRSQSKESIRTKLIAQTSNTQPETVAVCCCGAQCTHNCLANSSSPRAVTYFCFIIYFLIY